MDGDTIFFGFFAALAIVLIILGSIVIGSSDKITDSTAKKNSKSSGTGVLVIGLIFAAGSAFKLLHEMYGGSGTSYYF